MLPNLSAHDPLAKAVIARRQLFSSAHFYRQDQFSDEKNRAIFGRCYTPHGHGHNYVLEAFVEGPIDSTSGLVANLAEIDEILKAVTHPLDHQHLNFDVPEFKALVPTTENIALYLRDKILSELEHNAPTLSLNRIKLYETDDLWVEVHE